MKRHVLSIRVLVISLVAAVVCAAGAYGAHQWQLSRIASGLLSHAQKAEDEEQWDRAAEFLDRYLRINSQDGAARGRLALTFIKGAESPELKRQAVDLCYRALAAGQAADELKLRLELGELLVATGRFLEAEDEAQKVISHTSADEQTKAAGQRTLALALFGQLQAGSLAGERLDSAKLVSQIQAAYEANPQAVELAEVAATLYREYPTVVRTEVPALTDADRLQQANGFLDSLVENSPDDAIAWLARYRYRTAYELPGADEDLTRALALAPKEPKVVLTAAYAALRSAQTSEKSSDLEKEKEKFVPARKYFQQLITEKAYEYSPEPHLGLGDAMLQAEGLEQAQKVWKEGLDRFTQPTAKAAFHARIADALIAADRDREADASLSAIDEIVATVGGSISADEHLVMLQAQDMRRSLVLMKREQYLPAIQALQRLLTRVTKGKSGPDVAIYSWNQLGRAFAALEEWSDSATAFDRASTLQPQANEPRLAAAFAWLSAGRPELAAERAEQVIAAQPTFEALMVLAAAQLQIQISTSPAERSWTRLETVLQAAQQAPADQPRKWRADLLRAEYITYRTRAEGNPESGQQQAKAILDAAVTEHAQSPELLLRACLALENLGLPADADQVLIQMRTAKLPVMEIAVTESRLLASRKQFAEAKAVLEKANQSVSTTDRVRLQREFLNIADLSGDQKLLANLLESEITSRPADVRTICRRCELAVEQNDLAALQHWSGKLAEQGAVGQAWSQYYEVLRLFLESKGDSQKLQVASAACDRLATIKPNWGRGLVLRGMIEQSLGNLESASDAYERAVDSGITETNVYERLIASLEKQHRYADAEKYLSRLESWLPYSQRLTEFAGGRELRQDRPARAIEIARQAVARRPADAQARVWLARLLLLNNLNKQLPESEQEFLKAVELAPGDIRSWNGLFSYYLRTSAPEKARETLAELVKKVPLEAVERDFVVAQGLEMLGDWEAAEAAYQKAAGQSVKNATIQVRLAGVYLRTDPQRAIECLEKAVEWDPSSAPARRMLAALLASRGTDESLQKAEALLSGVSNSELAVAIEDRRLRALLLAQNGNSARIQRAIQLLQEIIADGKGSLAGDHLVLAQLYEYESRRLADKDQATSRLQAAHQQYVTVVARPNAAASHLIAFVEFLLRNGSASEATVWIEKLESMVPAPPKSNPDLIARIIDLRLKHLSSAECQAWLDRLENEEDGSLRPVILRARTLTAQGAQAEATSILNAKAQKLFAGAADDKAKIQIAKVAGDYFFETKQAAEAETWYQRLVELDAQQSPLVILSVARQGRVSDAIQLCIDRSQTDQSSRYAIVAAAVLAEAFEEPEAHQKAEPLIAAAIKNFDTDLNLLYSVGTLRVAQGKYDEAASLFRNIVRINPRHVAALNNLALILAESPANRTEALKMIDQAIGVVGENPGLLDTKGAILVYDGQSVEALPLLEVAARGSQVDPRHNLHLAAAYQLTEQDDLARDQLKTALDQQLETLILTRSDKDLLKELRSRLGL